MIKSILVFVLLNCVVYALPLYAQDEVPRFDNRTSGSEETNRSDEESSALIERQEFVIKSQRDKIKNLEDVNRTMSVELRSCAETTFCLTEKLDRIRSDAGYGQIRPNKY